MSDKKLVAVQDTTVPLAGGSVEIDGELVSSTSSATLIPGQVVRESDLDPAFLDGELDETVLRPATAEELSALEAAPEAEAEAEEEEVEEEPAEEAEFVPPAPDAEVPGDAGRDLAEEPVKARGKGKAGKE